jgi:hypothetical protein
MLVPTLAGGDEPWPSPSRISCARCPGADYSGEPPSGTETGASTLISVPVFPVDPAVADPVSGDAGVAGNAGTVGTVVTELLLGTDTGALTLINVPGVAVPTELPSGADTGASTLISVPVLPVDPVEAEPTS